VRSLEQARQHFRLHHAGTKMAHIPARLDDAVQYLALAAGEGRRFHQSTPLRALIPARKACFSSLMTLTVSARSRRALPPPRPVTTTLCSTGRLRSALSTRSSSRYL